MNKDLIKIKKEWDWLYKNGKLNEEAVLKEIFDYDCILEEVPKVYCEITGGFFANKRSFADSRGH